MGPLLPHRPCRNAIRPRVLREPSCPLVEHRASAKKSERSTEDVVSPEEAQQGDPLNGLSDAKRSRVDKLSVDYATKVIDLEIKPAGADFDMDAWVEWTDPDGKTDMRPCSFSGNALSELTRDFAPPEIEFGDNYVKGTITFDYSGVPNFEEARGTLSFYYSILPAP